MLQNHHAVPKYHKAEKWTVVRVHSIKGTVLFRETMNSDIYFPFTVKHQFRNNSS
jgi:hypothetical protein